MAGDTKDPLAALTRGEKAAWDAFVRRYAGLIVSAIRGVLQEGSEMEDLVQEVFARLCRDDFRLLKTYDPERAGMSTWLTIVARSTARDAQRRKRLPSVAVDSVPEAALSVEPVEPVEKLKMPEGLLSPRQRQVLSLLYDHELEVGEIALRLGVDPQTVRSMHHKALLKLRAHFAAEKG